MEKNDHLTVGLKTVVRYGWDFAFLPPAAVSVPPTAKASRTTHTVERQPNRSGQLTATTLADKIVSTYANPKTHIVHRNNFRFCINGRRRNASGSTTVCCRDTRNKTHSRGTLRRAQLHGDCNKESYMGQYAYGRSGRFSEVVIFEQRVTMSISSWQGIEKEEFEGVWIRARVAAHLEFDELHSRGDLK